MKTIEKFVVKVSKGCDVDLDSKTPTSTIQGWEPLTGIVHSEYGQAAKEIEEHQPTHTSVYQIDKIFIKVV